MKKLFLLLVTCFTLSSCDKDDNNCQGIDCLPPATQTGAGTFGLTKFKDSSFRQLPPLVYTSFC